MAKAAPLAAIVLLAAMTLPASTQGKFTAPALMKEQTEVPQIEADSLTATIWGCGAGHDTSISTEYPQKVPVIMGTDRRGICYTFEANIGGGAKRSYSTLRRNGRVVVGHQQRDYEKDKGTHAMPSGDQTIAELQEGLTNPWAPRFVGYMGGANFGSQGPANYELTVGIETVSGESRELGVIIVKVRGED